MMAILGAQTAVYPACPPRLGVHDVIFIIAGQGGFCGLLGVYPSISRRDTSFIVHAHSGYTLSPLDALTDLYEGLRLAMSRQPVGYMGYTGYIYIRNTRSRYVLDVPQRVPHVPQSVDARVCFLGKGEKNTHPVCGCSITHSRQGDLSSSRWGRCLVAAQASHDLGLEGVLP